MFDVFEQLVVYNEESAHYRVTATEERLCPWVKAKKICAQALDGRTSSTRSGSFGWNLHGKSGILGNSSFY